MQQPLTVTKMMTMITQTGVEGRNGGGQAPAWGLTLPELQQLGDKMDLYHSSEGGQTAVREEREQGIEGRKEKEGGRERRGRRLNPGEGSQLCQNGPRPDSSAWQVGYSHFTEAKTGLGQSQS